MARKNKSAIIATKRDIDTVEDEEQRGIYKQIAKNEMKQRRNTERDIQHPYTKPDLYKSTCKNKYLKYAQKINLHANYRNCGNRNEIPNPSLVRKGMMPITS